MDWLGIGHLTIALTSIAAGATVCFMKKGTRRHRLAGRVYAFGMLGVNITAFMIYDLFGRFGPFHYAAMFSLATVIAGWIPVRRRKPSGWMENHAYWMAGSYVGLLAAASAETFSRAPNTPFWTGVIAGTLLVTVAGFYVIRRTVPRILAGFGR